MVWWYQDTAGILCQAGRDLMQALTELPGQIWYTVRVAAVLLLFAACLLAGLYAMYGLFTSPAQVITPGWLLFVIIVFFLRRSVS